jgi:hypothetical protein
MDHPVTGKLDPNSSSTTKRLPERSKRSPSYYLQVWPQKRGNVRFDVATPPGTRQRAPGALLRVVPLPRTTGFTVNQQTVSSANEALRRFHRHWPQATFPAGRLVAVLHAPSVCVSAQPDGLRVRSLRAHQLPIAGQFWPSARPVFARLDCRRTPVSFRDPLSRKRCQSVCCARIGPSCPRRRLCAVMGSMSSNRRIVNMATPWVYGFSVEIRLGLADIPKGESCFAHSDVEPLFSWQGGISSEHGEHIRN